MRQSRLPVSFTRLVTSAKQALPLGVALAALSAGAAPAAAQTYVGNDFSAGSSLLSSLESIGNSDSFPPFVILQEYSPSGPLTSGAIFGAAGTVNDVSFYGGGKYDFTVYSLALDSSNAAKNEQTFTVVGDQTFSGDATTKGIQNLAANFSVGAGDYLAFAGVGPYYPQGANNAVGSDATYASSSEPQTYPTSFTAIAPTAGQPFTVGAHGDASATYEIVPNPFNNQGRSYGIGVTYSAQAYYLNSASLNQANLSWSNLSGQSNWVNKLNAITTPPTLGSEVYLNNRTGAGLNSPTIVNFDATTDPKLSSLTIDNAPGGYGLFVVLDQAANTLTSGAETIGENGQAAHLQTGGINNVTGGLTINQFGLYDLQGGILNAPSITVNTGAFYFDGGVANFTNFTATDAHVAAGTSAKPGTGLGVEVVAGAAGSLTPATFTQLGGSNYAATLSVGNGGFAQGVYNLQGGSLLSSNVGENIGNGGSAQFVQSAASQNLIGSAANVGLQTNGPGYLAVSGAKFRTLISGFSVSTPTTYKLQGGTLSTGSNGAELIGAQTDSSLPVAVTTTGTGDFEQSGGSNTTGFLGIGLGGTYNLTGGTLSANVMTIYGSTNSNIYNGGGFFISGSATAAIPIVNNSGQITINGASADLVVTNYNQTGGELIIQNNGKLDPTSVEVSGGVFGGDGAIIGKVNVSGGTVQAGDPLGALHIEGAYTQTGGTITFDVDPDGKDGFLESSLVFDPGDAVSITGTKIVFDFLDGAGPLAFFKSSAFSLDAFFEESDSSLFSSDFNLESLFAGDTFATNMRGFAIAGFGAGGGVDLVGTSAVPEPSTWAMLIVGFGGLGYAGWRRGRTHRAVI